MAAEAYNRGGLGDETARTYLNRVRVRAGLAETSETGTSLTNEIYKESNITIFALVFITSLFGSVVNMVTTMIVYNTYGILNLVTKGILTIPLINSTLSVLLYNLFKTSILKLKED